MVDVGERPLPWALVDFFVWDLRVAYRAARAHIPDPHGHCVGCATQRAVTRWPCLIAEAARRAIQLSIGPPAQPDPA